MTSSVIIVIVNKVISSVARSTIISKHTLTVGDRIVPLSIVLTYDCVCRAVVMETVTSSTRVPNDGAKQSQVGTPGSVGELW
jgi:hypothetical protein